MNKIYITGHKNPDTDTICSALAYAKGLQSLNFDVTALRLGTINPETAFVLKELNLSEPKLVSSTKELEKDAALILVDHNEKGQSIDDRDEINIIEVIDHHRLKDFETLNPIDIRMQAVGCTATILYQIMLDKEIIIDKTMAQLMLSAIISDTLLFKSPTVTDLDREVATELAEIAGVDIDEYGMKMLKAGTDFTGRDAKEILNLDAKQFKTDNGKFEVAQVSTVDIKSIYEEYESQFREEIKTQLGEKELDLFILVITDILECNSQVLVLGDKQKFFEEQFKVVLKDDQATLKNVVSRKKQIVPYL